MEGFFFGGEWGIRPTLANFLFARSGPAPQLTAPSLAQFPFEALE
jgi:hypothetical protein